MTDLICKMCNYSWQPRVPDPKRCPWCGTKLPRSLRPEWEKRLSDAELVADDPCVPTNLPENLATDSWWRKEGL